MLSALSNFDKRKIRVRNRIKNKNKSTRPRIVIFRSNKNISAQLIGIDGKVITSFSSISINEKDKKGVDIAGLAGDNFAKLCIKENVNEVVFDKGGYLYNGRVKAFAESCRKAGLKF